MMVSDKIIPGKSLGGIQLNSHIDNVYKMFAPECKIEKKNNSLILNDGLIVVGYGVGDELIYSVMCGVNYPYRFDGKLWAGMTVADVLNHSQRQIAYGGCVVVDGINGVGLPLPAGLDDFEQITDFLELDHVFENLSVFRI
ncbi:hypothetical protein [Acidovorax kalamii]|uniref:hypothetical protein n=1 Tax=Acidovorax kalamii TaxID=2004485 RepID=UPI0020900162|nr:hypothetical protein [Acidovorax kalamii]MCO5357160.1 hypothetical protein [Acidovorax kalamii]